ncbi:MAG TPA: 4Fe-4S dicluster domain-containing protein [bacterium]|nr:4Fe-4S dicluster domain-containing protein [bacterium]
MIRTTVIVRSDICDCCGTCAGVCRENAIELSETIVQIDSDLCVGCLDCVRICPMGALEGSA